MKNGEKETFDALLKIADFNIRQFNERRDYSWKVALAFWGTVIGSIAVISPNKDAIPPWAFIAAAVIVVLLHGFWLQGVFIADEKDKQLAFAARDQAIRLLKDGRISIPKSETGKPFLANWSVQFQIAVTIVVVSMATAYLILV